MFHVRVVFWILNESTPKVSLVFLRGPTKALLGSYLGKRKVLWRGGRVGNGILRFRLDTSGEKQLRLQKPSAQIRWTQPSLDV